MNTFNIKAIYLYAGEIKWFCSFIFNLTIVFNIDYNRTEYGNVWLDFNKYKPEEDRNIEIVPAAEAARHLKLMNWQF